MSNPMHGVFGCVSFSLTVFVPVHNDTSPARPKRVKLATIWCEYSDREKVVAEFKANNLDLRACDLRAEFTMRQILDCEFEK